MQKDNIINKTPNSSVTSANSFISSSISSLNEDKFIADTGASAERLYLIMEKKDFEIHHVVIQNLNSQMEPKSANNKK